MNQLPVRSKGAFGRGFAMLAGASALSCTPGSMAGAAALSGAAPDPEAGAAGVVLHAEAATLAAVTIATANRLTLDLMIVSAPGLRRIFTAVLLRVGRAEARGPFRQFTAVGKNQLPEDAGWFASANRVDDDRDVIAGLDGV